MKSILPSSDDSFVYSCASEDKWGYEQFIPEHILAYQVSGETHIFHQQGTFVLRKNQILLARKNQFAKSLKMPATDPEYKAVSIILRSEDLRRFAAVNNIIPDKRYSGKYNMVLKADMYLKSYFQSLVPFLEQPQRSNRKLAIAKVNEAIELLLHTHPDLNVFLFDFNEPYKINLETFMLKHFRYNAPIESFAKLTGRSLAGFKRDFVKQFKTPPAKWLKEKRLEEAFYLIHRKDKKPADIYLDLGFENLSHFYTCFKKKYGLTPTESLMIKK
ncbi:helix-turn-helix domain-containing protein [Taibaiella koreensis]|uniref:helix-turn-helix domain-containing protein n=1 Tax=Taibaiella koreensis TaxID=1268548 RepID=UPI000E59C733|nr:AraC family transcriptional regulator [Taibaiella koreensis]